MRANLEAISFQEIVPSIQYTTTKYCLFYLFEKLYFENGMWNQPGLTRILIKQVVFVETIKDEEIS